MLKLKVFRSGHFPGSNLPFHSWTCGQDLSYVFSGLLPERGKNSYFSVKVWSVSSQARKICPENSKSNLLPAGVWMSEMTGNQKKARSKTPYSNCLETQTWEVEIFSPLQLLGFFGVKYSTQSTLCSWGLVYPWGMNRCAQKLTCDQQNPAAQLRSWDRGCF